MFEYKFRTLLLMTEVASLALTFYSVSRHGCHSFMLIQNRQSCFSAVFEILQSTNLVRISYKA